MQKKEKEFFSFQWHITDQCDQRCRHCYIFSVEGRKHLVSMDLAGMKTVLKKVEEFLQPLDMQPVFSITGGDPILSPDFWNLADALKNRGIPFVVMGNPFHLDREVCLRLKENGCTGYQLSIDGTEETHDWFRKKGSFRETLRAISVLNGARIPALVSMTVSRKNYREVPEVMDIVEEAGAAAFGFARYVPASGDTTDLIPADEYRKLLDTYIHKRREAIRRGSFTTFALKDHLLALYLYEEGMFTPPDYSHTAGDQMPGGCHLGGNNLIILPDGKVMACRRLTGSVLGNIFHDDLRGMWEETKRRYRRYERFEACSGCRIEPWCRGCPAVADAACGSCFAPDPQCWHVVKA